MSNKQTNRTIDRTGWPKGEWDNEPDEVSFQHEGLACKILRTQMGGLCGYVGIPKSNPWFRCTDDDLESWINCHGGVTYTGLQFPDGSGQGLRVVGFDCAHAGDFLLGTYKFDRLILGGKYRNISYVTSQIHSIVKQVLELDIPKTEKFRVVAQHAACSQDKD